MKAEDYRDFYKLYFKEFNRLATGEFADLSYGNDIPNDTASSLESIVAYANYIKGIEGARAVHLLNAGAGASSWMFRKIFGAVICADPHKRYMHLVRMICLENKLYAGQFQNNMHVYGKVYHVYYDYGSIERLPFLGSAIEQAMISVYVDDVGEGAPYKPYRDHVIALCESMKLKWFDCKESLDEYGRAGIIIQK